MARHPLFAALPRFRKGAFGLFLLVVVISAVLADQPVATDLLLTPGGVLQGQGLWQPITANFLFPEGDVGLVLATAAVQWFIGSELEGFWGTRKYVVLVVSCAVVGHLASVLLALVVPAVADVTVGGATAIDLAAVTAFGVVFGKRPLRLFGALPLSSRGLAVVIAAVYVASPLARGGPWPVVVPWIVAIAAALVVTTQPWRRLRDSGKLFKSKRKRDHLTVVRPNRDLLN